jgi:hypothetical protein
MVSMSKIEAMKTLIQIIRYTFEGSDERDYELRLDDCEVRIKGEDVNGDQFSLELKRSVFENIIAVYEEHKKIIKPRGW